MKTLDQGLFNIICHTSVDYAKTSIKNTEDIETLRAASIFLKAHNKSTLLKMVTVKIKKLDTECTRS